MNHGTMAPKVCLRPCRVLERLEGREDSGISIFMHALRSMIVLSVLMMAGCVHINESSTTANETQIHDHLTNQLHCQRLDLSRIDKDHFTGTGSDATGEFTIQVDRQGDKINYKGHYTKLQSGPTGSGGFQGSASWSKSVTRSCWTHKYRETTETTTCSP